MPDSDSVGGAVEGTKRPSTSGRPDPDTSIKKVLGGNDFVSTIISFARFRQLRGSLGLAFAYKCQHGYQDNVSACSFLDRRMSAAIRWII